MRIDYGDDVLAEGSILLEFDGTEMASAWMMFNEVRKHVEPLGVEIPEQGFWDELKERALAQDPALMCLSVRQTLDFTRATLNYALGLQRKSGFDAAELIFALQAIEMPTAADGAAPS